MSARDIVSWLREWCDDDEDCPCVHCVAADEIDRLRAELADARNAAGYYEQQATT